MEHNRTERIDSKIPNPDDIPFLQLPQDELDSTCLVFDLRDCRQANALQDWRERSSNLAHAVTKVVLKHWILWPRLRSRAWRHHVGEIIVASIEDEIEIILRSVDGHVVLEKDAEVEASEICSCSITAIIADCLPILTQNRFDDQQTIMKAVEHIAEVLKIHNKQLLEEAEMQIYVKTSGRHGRQCSRCHKSRRYFCDHGIVDLSPTPDWHLSKWKDADLVKIAVTSDTSATIEQCKQTEAVPRRRRNVDIDRPVTTYDPFCYNRDFRG